MGSLVPLLAALVTGPVVAALPAAQDCLWSEAAAVPQARVEVQSLVVDDLLYLFGGFFDAALNATPRSDRYDPATDTWTRLADMPLALTHHTAAFDGEAAWIVGGYLGANGGPAMPSVLVYDVAGDRWSFGPQLPDKRAGGALVARGRSLHYFGGFPNRRDSAAEHWELDLDAPAAGWVPRASLNVGRGHLSGAVLDGKLYAIGGQFGHDVAPQDLDLVEVYDPASDSWSFVASLPTPRSHFEASTYVHDGRIVVAGGRNNQPGGAPSLADVTAYDPLLDTWIEQSPLPMPLLGPSAKPLAGYLHVSTGASNGTVPVALHLRREVDANLAPATRVNAGGEELALAEPWCADVFFDGGETYAVPGAPPIAGTVEDALYHTERTGTLAVPDRFAYRLPVAAGDYRVRLHFAEVFWSAPGERVFDVRIEDLLVVDDLDLVASVGRLTALVRTFDVEVVDGELTLEFEASVDRPKVSAIEVLRLPDDTLDTHCSGPVNSTGGPARLFVVGSTSVSERDLRLVSTGLPAGRLAIVAVSLNTASFTFNGAPMCIGGPMFLSPFLTTGGGTIDLRLPLGMPAVTTGPEWSFQVGYDDWPPFGVSFSDALRVRLTP